LGRPEPPFGTTKYVLHQTSIASILHPSIIHIGVELNVIVGDGEQAQEDINILLKSKSYLLPNHLADHSPKIKK
jgi:hypothetical protein